MPRMTPCLAVRQLDRLRSEAWAHRGFRKLHTVGGRFLVRAAGDVYHHETTPTLSMPNYVEGRWA